MEELSIATTSVDIKVVRVGGKQMTKAVFEQVEQPKHLLPEARTLDAFNAEVDAILGYVNAHGQKWLLYTNPAKHLRRARLDHWGYEVYPIIETRLSDEHHLFIAI